MTISFRQSRLPIVFAAFLAILASCTTPPGASLPPGMAFLGDSEEETYSEISQGTQRIVMEIELVDTVRPKRRLNLEGRRGYAVPAGRRRVQFRVVLPPVNWQASGASEARGFADVELVAGHRYRVAGVYDKRPHTFQLLDVTANQPVSPSIDLGFFGPVRRDVQFIPLLIPIKS